MDNSSFVRSYNNLKDRLDQITERISWEEIIDEWYGTISKDAIKEAVELAKLAFENNNVSILIEKHTHS